MLILKNVDDLGARRLIGHMRHRRFHQTSMLGAEGICTRRIQCNDGPMPVGPVNRDGERTTQGPRL